MSKPVDPVTEHYTAYPYPTRQPGDEEKRLVLGSPSHMDEVIHYIFGGRLPTRPLRILVAGGGTGDGLVMLAQHCADRSIKAEITYLDLSSASREIAEARIKIRKLSGIVFVTGSLLDVQHLAPGPYDYIDCCGVLHHLPNPAQGLAALTAVLAPHGGMGLMVYAPYGRSGVYPLQSALRRIAPYKTLPESERVDIAKRLAGTLPSSNLLRRNPLIRDHIDGGDAGIYDLLLHAQDRALTVDALARLVSDAGYHITTFIDPARYDPLHYVNDPRIRKQITNLGFIEKAALAEEFSSAMKVHIVYIARQDQSAQLQGSAIPMVRDNADLTKSIRRDSTVAVDFAGTTLRYPLPRLSHPILAQIDGHKSIDDIFAILQIEIDKNLSRENFDQQMRDIFHAYHALGQLHLRFA